MTPRRRLTPRDHVLRAKSEAALREDVRAAAATFGWRFHFTYDSRRSPEGWPDVTLAKRMPDGTTRLIFLELKTETGKATPAQEEWLALLARVPSAFVWVLRPRDWDLLLRKLGG